MWTETIFNCPSWIKHVFINKPQLQFYIIIIIMINIIKSTEDVSVKTVFYTFVCFYLYYRSNIVLEIRIHSPYDHLLKDK